MSWCGLVVELGELVWNCLQKAPKLTENNTKICFRGSLGRGLGAMLGSKFGPGGPLEGVWAPSWLQEPNKTPKGETADLQGPPWDPPRTPQELPPGPPRTPQKALGPFQDLPRTPKYPPRDPSGAPKASQGPPWDPPRCLRTPLQGLPGPLRPPWDLPRTSSIPFRSSQNPAAAPKTCFRTAQGLQNKARICS